jgi:hypothetical protein
MQKLNALALALALALTGASSAALAQNADSTGFSSSGVPSVSGVWDPGAAANQLQVIVNNSNNATNIANNATNVAYNAINIANNSTNIANNATNTANAALSEASQAVQAASNSGAFVTITSYSPNNGGGTYTGLCSSSSTLASGESGSGYITGYQYGSPIYNPTNWKGGNNYVAACPSNAPWFYPVAFTASEAGGQGGGT